MTLYVDLSANPDSVWISPELGRDGYCCTASGSLRCIRFYVTVNPEADQLAFTLATPPIPPGQEYQVDCGPLQSVDEPMCISGPGPYCLVYCKPGNDILSYKITSSKTVEASPDIIVSQGCLGKIWASGLNPASVQWNTIYPGAYGAFNSYLSCPIGCDTTLVVPSAGYPPYIDVEVSGALLSPCNVANIKDTVRVHFVTDKSVAISPTNPTICFGGIPATLSANPTGGAPPYSYLWSTGATTPTISVSTPGTYWVAIDDITDCPLIYDTVNVIQFALPITANAGPDQMVCKNNSTVSLSGSVVSASGGIWTTNGTGTFANNVSLNTSYSPSANDLLNGSVTFTLTTTGNGTCAAASDVMIVTFTPAPVVFAGNDVTVCANNSSVTLNGNVSVSSGGLWTSSGSGTFSNAASLGTLYLPSASDVAAGNIIITLTSTGNGNCIAVTDNILVSITTSPTVNAGPDVSVCANNININLNGTVTVATGGTWSGTGTGTFTNQNNLNTNYIPSNADILTGNITVTFTSTGNGNCLPVNDNLVINITPAPVVNAGIDQTACSAAALNIPLAGTVSIATGGTWSTTGTGNFSPNANTLNAVYNPSSADTASGSVTFTLTSTGNGNCIAVSDNTVLTIPISPIANAGQDQTICSNNSNVSLNGSVVVATGGIWSSNGTGIFANNNQLSTIYYPSATDISSGNVTLTITTTGNGFCSPVSDNLVITFTPSPTIDAGLNQSVCANNSDVSLSGIVTIAGGGTWTSSGTGSFSNANSLATTYFPSQNDITTGSVVLAITSTQNGNCLPVNDNLIVTILPSPIVNAGPDQTNCTNNTTIALNGTVSNAGGGAWSTSGTGTFSNSSSLNATYTPSQADITNGSATISLTSTGNGNCLPVSDNFILTIIPAPQVEAGINQTVCSNNSSASISGTFSNTSSVLWSTMGSGTFLPDENSPSATYIPSAQDISSGAVLLGFTGFGNGSCMPKTDFLLLTIIQAPVVNAGPDQQACSNNLNVTLAGSISGPTTTGLWTSTGTGTINPNQTSLTGVYYSTPADTISGSTQMILTSTNNGLCLAVKDTMLITYTPSPTISTVPDITVCANNANVLLNSTFTVSSGVQWTSSGTGSFIPDNTSISPQYIPSDLDTANGFITITAITTGNGNCIAVSDNLLLTITDAPFVHAGIDTVLCTNATSFQLNGTVFGGATQGQWSCSCSGSFTPGSNAIDATYNISPNDISNGSISLYFYSVNNGLCLTESDTLNISFAPAPIANAGSDQTVCANNSLTWLTGTSQNQVSVSWSTSGDGIFPQGNNVNSVFYQPGSNDISNGSVVLSFNVTNTCATVYDEVTINITPSPIVNAGPDMSVCNGSGNIALTGNISAGASTGIWNTAGSGSFTPQAINLLADYIPSSNDTANGTVTLTLTSTNNGNCLPVADTLKINFINSPSIYIYGDTSVCIGEGASLSSIVSGGNGSGVWTAPNGSGTFAPNQTSSNIIYTPGAQDITNGSVTLVYTSFDNVCLPVSKIIQLYIAPAPVVEAGPNQWVCKNNMQIVLNGAISGASDSVLWTTNGSGTFVPNANSLNASYIASATDQAQNMLQFKLTSLESCSKISDSLTVFLTPAPVVNAGSDQVICTGINAIVLHGSVTSGATTGMWTSNGNGIFSPGPNALTCSYQLSPQDILNGQFYLYLTSTNYGNCLPVKDSLRVLITPIPSVNAGPDKIVCANMPAVLNGTISGGSGTGVWTTNGDGYFTPSANELNASYVFGTADTSNSLVVLTLTATDACVTLQDQISINISPAPYAFAGNDAIVCSNNPNITLNGYITSWAQPCLWISSGTGQFQPAANSLNAVYVPSASDILSGQINLVLQSTNNQTCRPAKDTLKVNIISLPNVNAGIDKQICKGSVINLSGIVSGGMGTGQWTTTNGSGMFIQPDTNLTTIYQPSAIDYTGTGIYFVLMSTNNGNCIGDKDTVLITFRNLPVANAGDDDTICSNNSGINLSGVVQNAGGGFWTSAGDGTFNPGAGFLQTQYIPGANDISSGSVNLTFTTTQNGSCQPVSDIVSITVSPSPVVNAGPDRFICSGVTSVGINGLVSGTTNTGVWTSLTGGTFFPNSNTLNSVYFLSAADMSSESFSLVLTSTNNGLCSAVSDTVIVFIADPPQLNAGPDKLVCKNNPLINLNGSFATGSSTVLWTVINGTGNFMTSPTQLAASYMPSQEDINAGNLQFILLATDVCIARRDTVKITFTPSPVVYAGPDRILCVSQSSINLTGSVSGGTTSGQWSSMGNGAFTNVTSMLTTYFFGNADTSNHRAELILISTNNGNCLPVSDTLTISLGRKPIADYNFNNLICKNTEAIFDNNSYISGGSISNTVWNFGGGYLDTANQISHTFTNAGNFNVGMIAISDIGCRDTIVKTINVKPGPTVDFSTSPLCKGDSIVFTNLSSPGVTWNWSFGNGSTSILQNPLPQVFDSVKNYTVSLSVTDQFNCTTTITETIHINPSPLASFITGNLCEGGTASFIDKSTVVNDTIKTWLWNFGDGSTSALQNPSHTFQTSDTVTISLTVSTRFCSDTYTIEAAPYPHPAFTAVPNFGCSPLFVTFITDTAGGSVFQWNFGDGIETVGPSPTHIFHNSGANDTIYKVKLILTTRFGCVDSAMGTVTVYPSPVSNFSFTPSFQCSPATVSFLSTSTGATSFNWAFSDGTTSNNENTTHIFNNTGTQTQYFPVILTVTSQNSCSDSSMKYVPVNANPVFNIQVPDDSLCNPGLVTFTCEPNAVSYKWDFGDNTTFSGGQLVQHMYTNWGTQDMTYSVSVAATSFNGCIDTAQIQIVIHPSPTALFTISQNTGCTPLNITLTNQSVGASVFQWNFGDGTSQTTSTGTINHVFTNSLTNQISYNVKLTAVSENGCENEMYKTVTVYPPVYAEFSTDTAGCSPLTINFINNSQYASSYLWSFGDGGFSTNQNPSHIYLNTSQTTINNNTYLVAESPFGCRDTSAIKVIHVYPQPNAQIALSNTSGCSPFKMEITNNSTGADYYLWNFGNNSTSTSSAATFNHTYVNQTGNIANYSLTLLLQNSLGCTDTIMESVNIFPQVQSAFTSDTAGCSPLVINYTNNSTGAVTYEWQFGDGNTSTNENSSHTFFNLSQSPAIYLSKLITSSTYGCKDTSENSISVYPQPIGKVDFISNSGCSPYNTTIIDSTTGVSVYYWNFGNGTSTGTQFISSHLYQHNDTVPVNYNFSLITENIFHCFDTITETIKVYPKVKSTFTPATQSGCSPVTVNYLNNSLNASIFDWNFGDGTSSGLRNTSHTYVNSSYTDKTFNVSLISISNYGCRDTSFGTFTAYAMPTADFSVTPTFQYYPLRLVYLDNLTQGSNWSYNWTFGDGTSSNLAEPGTHTYATIGEYEILLRVYSPYCSDTVAHTVKIAPNIPIAAFDTSFTGCAPLKVKFKNKSSGAVWYKWEFGDGGSSNDFEPEYTYTIPGIYTVQLTAGNNAGQDSKAHVVTVFESPKAFFRINPSLIQLPDDVLRTFNLSDNGYKYLWKFGDGDTSTEFEPNHLYKKEGNFNISLYVTSEKGCVDSMIEENGVKVVSNCEMIFPNAFTPNILASNGGIYNSEERETSNDIFHPLWKNIIEYRLEIFNRWGELIFVSTDINIGWDGYYQGKLAQVDVYVWKAEAKCYNGKLLNQVGGVTLIR